MLRFQHQDGKRAMKKEQQRNVVVGRSITHLSVMRDRLTSEHGFAKWKCCLMMMYHPCRIRRLERLLCCLARVRAQVLMLSHSLWLFIWTRQNLVASNVDWKEVTWKSLKSVHFRCQREWRASSLFSRVGVHRWRGMASIECWAGTSGGISGEERHPPKSSHWTCADFHVGTHSEKWNAEKQTLFASFWKTIGTYQGVSVLSDSWATDLQNDACFGCTPRLDREICRRHQSFLTQTHQRTCVCGATCWLSQSDSWRCLGNDQNCVRLGSSGWFRRTLWCCGWEFVWRNWISEFGETDDWTSCILVEAFRCHDAQTHARWCFGWSRWCAGWNSGCDEETSPLEDEQSRAGVRDEISWEAIDQDRAGISRLAAWKTVRQFCWSVLVCKTALL